MPILAEWLVEHWREPDNGIWEIRGAPTRYTHSLVTAVSGLEGAAALADQRVRLRRRRRLAAGRGAIARELGLGRRARLSSASTAAVPTPRSARSRSSAGLERVAPADRIQPST